MPAQVAPHPGSVEPHQATFPQTMATTGLQQHPTFPQSMPGTPGQPTPFPQTLPGAAGMQQPFPQTMPGIAGVQQLAPHSQGMSTVLFIDPMFIVTFVIVGKNLQS